MGAAIELDYDGLPAIVPSYVRAATTLSGGLKDATIPAIVARVPNLSVRAESLARYRKVCRFEHAPTLPVTYPHVLAFPVQMAVMTHKQFPLKLLGMLHVRNSITQHRAIAVDETLNLILSAGGHREVAKGIEFDLVTRLTDGDGLLVWEETGTMLSRQSKDRTSGESAGDSRSEKRDPSLAFSPTAETTWQVPADIGRRYATVAGDYNPIHLSRWTAKLFGFPRAIATGMWSKARAAAELSPQLTQQRLTLSLAFKKPLFLPGEARFVYALDERGADFALTNKKGNIQHLLGEVRYR